jgi:hypothetical protein
VYCYFVGMTAELRQKDFIYCNFEKNKMPKKFGTNDKSAEARAKKDSEKKEKQEKVKKAKEDALWFVVHVVLTNFH